MDKKRRESFHKELEINGHFIARNAGLYMVLMGLIALFECILFVYTLGKHPSTTRTIYLFSYILLFGISISMLPFLQLARKNRITQESLGLLPNIYAVFILFWSALLSGLDMQRGGYPIVFLTVAFSIGGLVLIHPYPYIVFVIISLSSLLAIDRVFRFGCFFSIGGYINLAVFVAMSFLVAYRQHTLLLKEQKSKEELRRLSRTDYLTGLGNETLYYSVIDEVQRSLDEGKAEPFAIAVMDVNGVKTTNDLYGHRFGCHLIMTAGKMLPAIFPQSQLFHVGGDEFIAILQGTDYTGKDEALERFQKALYQRELVFENQPLVLSVAIGIVEHQGEKHYNELFQKADKEMYRQKTIMKKALGLPER